MYMSDAENICKSFLQDGDVDRIATRDYIPSDDDVVRARLRTLGVQEHRIHFETGTSYPSILCCWFLTYIDPFQDQLLARSGVYTTSAALVHSVRHGPRTSMTATRSFSLHPSAASTRSSQKIEE